MVGIAMKPWQKRTYVELLENADRAAQASVFDEDATDAEVRAFREGLLQAGRRMGLQVRTTWKISDEGPVIVWQVVGKRPKKRAKVKAKA